MVVKICMSMFIILALPLASCVKMGRLPAESVLQFLMRRGAVLIPTYLLGFFSRVNELVSVELSADHPVQ